MTGSIYIFLSAFPYHYEIIESIIGARHQICNLDNTIECDQNDRLIIIMLENESYRKYMENKYNASTTQVEFIIIDNTVLREVNGVKNIIDNILINANGSYNKKKIHKNKKNVKHTDVNNKDTEEHPDNSPKQVNIINITYYDPYSLLNLKETDKRIYTLASLGTHGKYHSPVDMNFARSFKNINIQYYYVIHDVPTEKLPNIPGNIICMTPLHQRALPSVVPRCIPCVALPYLNNTAIPANDGTNVNDNANNYVNIPFNNIKQKRMDIGYPIFMIQGSATRRFMALLRGALIRLPTLYPNFPEFKIHILSDYVKFTMGLYKIKHYLKIVKTRDFQKYHNHIGECWGIIPMVSPYTQPRYYAPVHLPESMSNAANKVARYSLTSSINYGEAYKQCFIIEENLYDIYSTEYDNMICLDSDNHDQSTKTNDAICGWPWLRDNSYTHKTNGLTMDEKIHEFLKALLAATTRYYDELKNHTSD